MTRHRIFLMLVIIIVLSITWTGRLLWLQASLPLAPQEKAGASVKQRQQSIVLDSGRGHIYDRRLRPLTGHVQYVLAVFPLTKEEEQIEVSQELLNSLHIDHAAWQHFRQSLREPAFWKEPGASRPLVLTEAQRHALSNLNLPGVLVVPYQMRYADFQSAVHLIGFTGENPKEVRKSYSELLERGQLSIHSKIGVAGLEKTFEKLLRSRGEIRLNRYTTAEASAPLEGLGWRLKPPKSASYPLKVITTLDLTIQRQIEDLLQRKAIHQGAVVVLDAANADILAMASRPNYHPLSLHNADWTNRAITATAPGSIFKTVVAAAALEKRAAKPGEQFYCGGDLGKYKFKCWNQAGHGWLSFREAYAKSCNITFAKVMQRLNPEDVSRMAERLGLTQPIGWTADFHGERFAQLDAEEAGRVFVTDAYRWDEGVRLQTAIGQRDAAISPLQAANLVVTILGEGEVKRPRIVSKVQYQDGGVKEKFSTKHLQVKAFSAGTANHLRHWMVDTVRYGTGISLKNNRWQTAGKTGTAQVFLNGREGENQWFIGFGPVEQPKYAAAVLVQGNDLAQGQATELFDEVMQILAESV